MLPQEKPSPDHTCINQAVTLKTFDDFGLRPALLEAIKRAGFSHPTAIQQQAIPIIQAGHDLIAQAQTGSGKTAAFVIPAISNLKFSRKTEVLVLVPTRELCKQVVKEFERLGNSTGLRTATVVGGEPPFRQIEAINRGAHVVVATPGRLLDHLSSKKLKHFDPSLVVIDEADEMLDMGFIDDIRKILKFIRDNRQTLLFSATIPSPIVRLAREQLKEPKHIRLDSKTAKHEDIEQKFYVVRPKERESALVRLLHAENPDKALIFCRTKKETDGICRKLVSKGIKARCLHGDLSQYERNRAIQDLRSGQTKILVATDVASRGLDIAELPYVINYHPPENKERYTHRIGRTGRAGRKGKAVSLITPDELKHYQHLSNRESFHDSFDQIPSLSDTQTKQDAKFIKKIFSVPISPEVEDLCERFVSEELAYEFLLRLCSYAKRDHEIGGPEHIGYRKDELHQMQQAMKSTKFKTRGKRSRTKPRSFHKKKKSFRAQRR